MKKENISPEEATTLLRKLIGLKISSVNCLGNSVIISFGASYQIKTITLEDNGWLESVTEVFFYEMEISSVSQICLSSMSDPPAMNAMEDYLINSMVKDALIFNENVCVLKLSTGIVNIVPDYNKTYSWRVYQPHTEEDCLVLEHNILSKNVIESRRWSSQYVNQLELWHPFPLATQEEYEQDKLKNFSVLNALVGTQFIYAFKSEDMNFYNLGFQSQENDSDTYEIHITCSIQIKSKSEQTVVFWGDSEKTSFEQYIRTYLHQAVLGVQLLESNILQIVFKETTIAIYPADDRKESWRLLLPDETQVIASNTWIVKTDQ